jgi:hypothetical protein
MPALLRSRLTLLAAVAALAAALPACGTDEAVQNDAKDAQQDIDKGLGNLDEDAKDAAKGAADDIEKGVEDIDGR